MDIRSLALRGAAWVAAARIAINLLGLVSTLFLARLLTPDDFGLVAIGTTILAVVSSFTDLPLSTALIQHAQPDETHFNTVFTLNFIRSALVTAAVAAAAYPISIWYGDARLFELIMALSLSSFIMCLSNPKRVLFTRELNFHADFVQGIAMKLTGFVVGIVFALIYKNYWALVVGSLAAQVSFVVISYIQLPYLPAMTFRRSRELLSFSIWLSYSQIVNTVSTKIDQLLIGFYLGSEKLGIYSFGDNLANLPTRELTTPISQMLFPWIVAFTSQQYILVHNVLH
ncbi:MAG: hypothetical protein EOO82_02820 [Oxalobacteraceae bacterium]|nr:MAG: hypothetical protein EOO82_02820 [Oxalobacteraceae bacterium]